MIDRLLTGLLAITVLAGASVAMTVEYFASRPGATAETPVVQLPRVVVTGRVQPASTDVAKVDVPISPATAPATRPQ